MIEQPVARPGAGCGIAERQPVVLIKPDEVRRDDHKANRRREIRPRSGKTATGVRIDQHEKHKRQSEHDHEIFCPKRKAEGEAQHRPMAEAAGSQRAMKRQSGQRPERQLNHVVIEFRRSEVEVMQSVDDENRGCCRGWGCHAKHESPYGRKRRQNAHLSESVIGDIGSNRAVGDLDEPPRQGRQFVVAELPLASVGERLDDVERQVGIERERQDRPDGGVGRRKQPKACPRPLPNSGKNCRGEAGHRLPRPGDRQQGGFSSGNSDHGDIPPRCSSTRPLFAGMKLCSCINSGTASFVQRGSDRSSAGCDRTQASCAAWRNQLTFDRSWRLAMTSPMIQRDASEARNSTTEATSSCWPMRLSDCIPHHRGTSRFGLSEVRHVGVDHAGCDGVDADAARSERTRRDI
jgi:hypothetical protein